MTTTLSEGVKVPDVGSVNWAGDLEVNWNLLNGALANLSGNVKLDRDNTWTGEQSFTLPIVGSITGTASKAIADEDGTSIKTGYVNVAGNQTVTGQKTWSGVNYFNNENLYQTASNPRYAFKSSILEIGVQPSGHCTATVDWLDSNDVELGYSRFVEYNNSIQTYEVLLKNKAENGSLSPAGNDISASLQLALFKTGSSQLNLGVDTVVPTSNNSASLGSSSYQWSSVYAQNYYYNGTAWGLDKANVWTAQQKITGTNSRGVLSIYNPAHNKGSATSTSELSIGTIFLGDGGATGLANSLGFVSCDLSASGNKTTLSLSAIKNETSSTERANLVLLYDKSDNTNPEKMLCKGTVLPNSDLTYNLGTSTNKWKTLNGVNPGALSLPDASAKVQIDIPASWVWDGTTENSYVAPITGWLAIGSSQATYVRLFNSMSLIGSVIKSPISSDMRTYIPMIAGDMILISGITSSSFLIRIYPCLGNV